MRRQNMSNYNLIISIFCFSISSTLLGSLFLLPPSDRVCIAQSVVYKPVSEAINYEWVNFGDYFHPPTIYRGPSTPLRDAAWENLMIHDLISVPEAELSFLNQSTSTNWKYLADGGIAAVLGGHHQMKCLDLLRRHSHMKLEEASRSMLRTHVDHCVELLRHQLMCAGDVTPFLELSAPTLAGSRPDLETMHKCRKYDDLKDWTKQRAQGKFYSKWEMAK